MKVLDTIRPLMVPIQPWLDDPAITEIMVTEGGAKVFIEVDGHVDHVPGCVFGGKNLIRAIEHIGVNCGISVSSQNPILEARLYDGDRITARIAAVLPPCAIGGAVLTIRRFGRQFTLPELVADGMLTQAEGDRLRDAVRLQRRNVLIAGGCGVGKTTLLSALIDQMDDRERVAIIEETAEIQARKPDMIKFEAQQEIIGDSHEQTSKPITLRQLFRHSLRHRPDRIILGEVRGPEAYDLLQSLNSGHAGSLCTIHANSADDALARLADCALEANVGWSEETAAKRIDRAIDLLVYVQLQNRKRVVSQIIDRKKATS